MVFGKQLLTKNSEYIPIILYYIVALLDDLTTWYGITTGIAYEANPVGLPLWSFILKYAYPFLWLPVPPKIRKVLWWLGVIVTSITVFHNTIILLQV